MKAGISAMTPDLSWQRSIPNLMAYIADERLSRTYEPLDHKAYGLPAVNEKPALTNIILIVIDALGRCDIDGEAKFLNQHLSDAPLISTFPSGTASAMTAYFTGLPPFETGIVGWHQWWEAAEGPITPLLFRRRGGGDLRSEGHTVADLFVAPAIFNAMRRECVVINPAPIANSAVSLNWAAAATRYAYDDLTHMFRSIETVAKRKKGSKFILAYADVYDTSAHKFGARTQSDNRLRGRADRTKSVLRTINDGMEQLFENLRGTDSLVILVSDHGQIETEPSDIIFMSDYKSLSSKIAFRLTGEPRWAYAHVRGPSEEFRRAVQDELGGYLDITPTEQAIDEGYFGLKALRESRRLEILRRRAGDFILIPKDEFVLLDHPRSEPYVAYYTGYHGGRHEDELNIPVVRFVV
jgi:hypothetical protein